MLPKEHHEKEKPSRVDSGLETLVITVIANASGDIDGIGEGDTPVKKVRDMQDLQTCLAAVFKERRNPFDQVILQTSYNLQYSKLMQVVEICTRQRLPNGEKLRKLSFVVIPETKQQK